MVSPLSVISKASCNRDTDEAKLASFWHIFLFAYLFRFYPQVALVPLVSRWTNAL